jgi:hypothetical protein
METSIWCASFAFVTSEEKERRLHFLHAMKSQPSGSMLVSRSSPLHINGGNFIGQPHKQPCQEG